MEWYNTDTLALLTLRRNSARCASPQQARRPSLFCALAGAHQPAISEEDWQLCERYQSYHYRDDFTEDAILAVSQHMLVPTVRSNILRRTEHSNTTQPPITSIGGGPSSLALLLTLHKRGIPAILDEHE